MKRIFSYYSKKLLDIISKSSLFYFFCIFLGLLGINYFPTHQSSSVEQSETFVANPFFIDPLIPGIDNK